MSTILLSLLLVVLIALGLAMGKRAVEQFTDGGSQEQQQQQSTTKVEIDMSPAMANAIRDAAAVAAGANKAPVTVDTLKREREGRAAACPDMSKYIRMDEIPCWNCTLP